MGTLIYAISLILSIVKTVIIVHFIMSWLLSFQVLNMRQPIVAQLWGGLTQMLEPIYGPIRRFMPNTGMIDLSPMVALIIILILERALINNAGAFI
jgi:YggT family protein